MADFCGWIVSGDCEVWDKDWFERSSAESEEYPMIVCELDKDLLQRSWAESEDKTAFGVRLLYSVQWPENRHEVTSPLVSGPLAGDDCDRESKNKRPTGAEYPLKLYWISSSSVNSIFLPPEPTSHCQYNGIKTRVWDNMAELYQLLIGRNASNASSWLQAAFDITTSNWSCPGGLLWHSRLAIWFEGGSSFACCGWSKIPSNHSDGCLPSSHVGWYLRSADWQGKPKQPALV